MSATPNFADALGHGATDKRIEILRGIDRSGSISQAARDAGVSYKAAWQAIAILTNLAGVPLVDRVVGGAGGGGARLTGQGVQLLALADELVAARRAVGGAIGPGAAHLAIRTSMRNQWPVRIERLRGAGPTREVLMALGEPPQLLMARVTRESAELLALAPGLRALALCKATAVRMQARHGDDDADATSPTTRNWVEGVVSQVARGSHGDEVAVRLAGGTLELVGFAAQGQRLRHGQRVWTVIDPTALVIALPA